MPNDSPPRAVVKGVTVTFGLINARVDLVPAQLSKATRARANISTTNLCPTCEEPVALRSRLWCENDHGPFTQDEARKGIMGTEGTLQEVEVDAVAEAKAPTVAERTAMLSVFPARQVEEATLPSGNLFRLRPEPSQSFALLMALVADTAMAYLCEMVVKGKTCLYRATVQRGTIVLVELVRPERLLPYKPAVIEIDPEIVDRARQFARAMMEPFDPADWSDQRQQRLVELRAKLSEPEATAPPAPTVQAAARELLALLGDEAA